MYSNVETWANLSVDQREKLLSRPALANDKEITKSVAGIIRSVRRDGDAALRKLTTKFDKVDLEDFKVTAAEFRDAADTLSDNSKRAIGVAIRNVSRFHEAQLPAEIDLQIDEGIRCERRTRAIDSVGLYVPAGSAPLPSAAVMLAIPARIAGCSTRIMCTPVSQGSRADPATLYVAQECGISNVFKLGGAQAIAAMAYGSQSVPRVNKIFGPGNSWVTAAKRQVATDPSAASIDMPAGPSEALVIADSTANPLFVAADLLSQAEHGADSQVILLSTCMQIAEKTVQEIDRQLKGLTRKEIARKAMTHCRIVMVNDLQTAMTIANQYAPEHLLLQIDDPRRALDGIQNAGSVFVGPWSPESVGDYCSGTNHVLPTFGMARSCSGLGVEHFLRQMTIQELSKAGLRSIADSVIELATLEGLDGHANAVRVRLDENIAMETRE